MNKKIYRIIKCIIIRYIINDSLICKKIKSKKIFILNNVLIILI